MQCPLCHTEATTGTWRSRIRRGDKTLWVDAGCWRCSKCRTSMGPFQFLSPDLETENEALASKLWQENFNEAMPPGLPGARIRKLMRTPEGRARVGNAFGKVLEQQIQGKKP